ncbi:MAG: LacI family transcriptional regulator [Clostridiaceae bacterium]|nr:LacI family transcriptional regulator [Clostridiaceae bacterium]
MEIPDDIEIITYGDNQYYESNFPSLTSIHVPIESIIKECLHILLDMIKSKVHHPISRIHPLNVLFQESCPKE